MSFKSKKVVFVTTPVSELEDDQMEAPLGILYLATILNKQGIPCVICDLSGLPEEKWLANLDIGDIYAFSLYSVTYFRTLKIRNLIKSNLNPLALTIVGGPHASALPKDCVKEFDIVITGEAEKTFCEIVKIIQEGKKVSGVFHGVSVTNLDSVPYPDYDLVDFGRYHRVVECKPSLSIVSSRGCPFNCPYCNSRISNRGSYRVRSPENIADEISLLIKKYGVRNYRFGDDLFTLTIDRVKELSSVLKPLNITYRVFAQSQTLNREVCSLLHESGCRHVSIGIETMSKQMMKKLRKNCTVEDNIAALKNCIETDLKTRIYLMVGFPGETTETVQESLNVLINCFFNEFIVYSFIPYPGTPVWHEPNKWDVKKIDRDFSKYVQVGRKRSTCFTIWTNTFSPEDVKSWRQWTIDELEKHGFLWAGQSSDNK